MHGPTSMTPQSYWDAISKPGKDGAKALFPEVFPTLQDDHDVFKHEMDISMIQLPGEPFR